MNPLILTLIALIALCLVGAYAIISRMRAAHARMIAAMRRDHDEAIGEASERAERVVEELEARHRRVEREARSEAERAHLKLARDLFAPIDDLERAIEVARARDPEITSGLDLVRASLERALARHGVHPIRPDHEEAFDPASHEAIAVIEVDEVAPPDHPSQSIHEVMRVGWRHKDQSVLRPATVSIARRHVAPKEDGEEVAFDFEEPAATEQQGQDHEQTSEVAQPATSPSRSS